MEIDKLKGGLPNQIKLASYSQCNEVEEEEGDQDLTAQALITLHDSVQKMPRKHKTALQEAVHEASPTKKLRTIDEALIKNTSKLAIGGRNCSISNDVNKEIDSDQMQRIGSSMNNILKQSAGRKWVFHEWFYSNVDRSLLLGENEFQICLKQLFPSLKAKQLTRYQWSMIRRLMGKPRRCSSAFFTEERRTLEEKRKKIRLLHQLKGFEVTNVTQFKDLPEEIPVPMVVGTKVSAKIHPAGNGVRLFTGTVDAIDNVNNSFRISFDRNGVDSKSVKDIDTASENYECMNLKLFMVKERPKIAGATSPTVKSHGNNTRDNNEDSSCPSPTDGRLTKVLDGDLSGMYGGFPIKLLLHMTKLSRLVKLKKKFIDSLKLLNDEAEIKHPFNTSYSYEFQKQYAFLILELEKINTQLTETFSVINGYMTQTARPLICYDQCSTLKLECDEIADDMILQSQHIITNVHLKGLVAKFTSLMLQINKLSEAEPGSLDLSLIDESLKEIKSVIQEENVSNFEDQIETNIGFIKSGLQNGNSLLASFIKSTTFNNREELLGPNGYMSSEYEDVEEEIDEEELESGDDYSVALY